VEHRLVIAYQKIRSNARNGLAVVTVQRDACGGCFNKIPPQRQLDIRSRKKIIVCEYCGRSLSILKRVIRIPKNSFHSKKSSILIHSLQLTDLHIFLSVSGYHYKNDPAFPSLHLKVSTIYFLHRADWQVLTGILFSINYRF